MKQLFITEVEQSLLSILDNAQMKALHEALTHALWGKNIVAVDAAIEQPEAQSNAQLLEMFLSAKRVEGCSEKTLHYYQSVTAKLLRSVDKRVVHVTTDDLAPVSGGLPAGQWVQPRQYRQHSPHSVQLFRMAGGRKLYPQKSRPPHSQDPHQ